MADCGDRDLSALCAQKPITIIQGEDRTLKLDLVQENTCNKPFDITGVTEITAQFPKSDNSALEKLLSLSEVTVIEAKCGQISVDLSDTDTALLKTGIEQNFQVIVDIGTTRRIAKFKNLLTVEASEF